MAENVVSNTKIALCTLRYSDNLGDGVIGDCVEYLLKKTNPSIDVYHLDMAGRLNFLGENSIKSNESKGIGKTYFYKLPHSMQKNIFKFVLWPFIYRKKLDVAISNALNFKPNLLFFGGGQVLNDILLNFPLKFDYVCQRFISENVKIVISGVGVSKNWSTEAKYLFNKSLNSKNVLKLYVRDFDSKSNLIHYETNKNVLVTLDPAIWAKETYNINVKNNVKKNIGLGIANPYELGTHTESDQFNSTKFDSFWLAVIDGIDTDYYNLSLFTNGSSEDYYYLQYFSNLLSFKRPYLKFKVIDRALIPSQLVNQISEMDLVIAHRLHANIISYSLGIPSIALEWDKKVKSFMEVVKRERWCFSSLDDGQKISQLVDLALDEGVDLTLQAELKNTCFKNIQDCLKVIN